MTASPGERAGIYRELHRDYLDRFNATRQIEWIVNAALWTGIVVAGGWMAGHVDLKGWPWWAIVAVGLAGGLLHWVLWMYPIQCSEDADELLARQYRELAHLALKEDPPPAFPKRDNRSVYKKWFRKFDWLVVECGTTVVLVLLVLFFLKHVGWILPKTG